MSLVMFFQNQKEKMFKVTIAYVVVNLIIVDSCLATSKKSVQSGWNMKESSDLITNSVHKQSKNSVFDIGDFFTNTKEYISQECKDKEGILSSLLNNSIKSIFKKFIESYKKRVAEIRMPGIPNVDNIFSNGSPISEFRLKNITLKGLDDILINKLEYNVCKLSSEIDINQPKLEMTATYVLNGTINNFPVTGAGNFKMNADSVNYYEKSYVNCESNIFSEEGCNLTNMNVTTDIKVEQVTMYLSGVKYKDLTESQFNGALNNYIRKYLKSDKTDLKRRVTDMVVDYKDKHVMNFSLIKMLAKMKEDLKKFQSQIKQRHMSLPLSSTEIDVYLNFISSYL